MVLLYLEICKCLILSRDKVTNLFFETNITYLGGRSISTYPYSTTTFWFCGSASSSRILLFHLYRCCGPSNPYDAFFFKISFNIFCRRKSFITNNEMTQVTLKQESPPAWTQEAYRPPCSEYLTPPPPRLDWPPPPPACVKTLPSRRTTYAGGNNNLFSLAGLGGRKASPSSLHPSAQDWPHNRLAPLPPSGIHQGQVRNTTVHVTFLNNVSFTINFRTWFFTVTSSMRSSRSI